MNQKNYYDWLEININASPEIIEKAYKTLVKKYHPDLQGENEKQKSEELLKKINEAYEILSNPQKREEYNNIIKQISPPIENYKEIYEENKNLKNEINYLKSNITSNDSNSNNFSHNNKIITEQYKKQYQETLNRAYYDAYIQDLKNRGYKIKYTKSWKDYFKGFIFILVIVSILFLLWHIPIVKNYLLHLYETNDFFHFTGTILNNFFEVFQ